MRLPKRRQLRGRRKTNADPAISQRDALQALLEDETLAVRDSPQNQAKTGEAAAAPAASAALSTRDLSVPPATAPSPTPSPAETTPAPEGGHAAIPRAAVLPAPPVSTPPAPDGEEATPDKVLEGGGDRLQGAPGARRAQQDEAPAVTPAAPRPKALGWHGYRPRPPARPQPQPTFWQRLFGHKETTKPKPDKPRP